MLHNWKRLTLGIICAGLAAGMLGGCGNAAKTASEETTSADTQSQENTQQDAAHLNVAMFWVSTSLDPADGYDGWVLSRIGAGETLVKLDENAEAVPCLAESWEQTDDYTWVFQIREGVTFSNGNPVDAQACMNAIQRAFDLNSRSSEYFQLDSMEADGQTLTIHTTQPTGAIVNNLCEPLFTIVDTSVDEQMMDTAPVCTGPYVIDTFLPETEVTLVCNDDYWDGTPGLDSISVFSVPDSDSRVLAMQSGEADLTITIDNSNLALFADESQYNVYETIGPRTNVVYYNNARPLLDEKEFRQAISMAVDKDTYAELIGCAPATGLYSTALVCGQQVEDIYPYDPQQAGEILDSLGYLDTDGDGQREADGKNIQLQYYIAADHGSADSTIIAQAVQSDLIKVGINVQLIQTENMSDVRASGNYDFCSANDSTAPTADPEIFLVQHYLTGGSSNYQNYSNPEVDQLIEALASTFDPDQRQQQAGDISRKILEDAGSLYIGYIYGNTVTSSRVSGAVQFPIDYYIITKDITIK
mgnify:FL=1